MRKTLLGVLIANFIFAGSVLPSKAVINSVNNVVNATKEERACNDIECQKLIDNTEFKIIKDDYSIITIEGVLENTMDKSIDFMEIHYEGLDDNDCIIDKSFCNEVSINPGEKRKIVLYPDNADRINNFVIKAKSSVI